MSNPANSKTSPSQTPKEAPQQTPAKVAYDVMSWVLTQACFSFTVTPFILLSLDRCLKAWSRVYFYAVVGVIVSFGALASPLKPMLQKRV